MSTSQYMTAKEAAKALNVSVATLYAYVSRGLIRSEASAQGKRQRRYNVEDVEKLVSRRDARRNPEKLAQDALHWGAPVLESSITLIHEGKLFYRGIPITEIIEKNAVEEVAALIWTGKIENARSLFHDDIAPSAQKYETMLLHIEVDGANLSPIQAFQTFLPIASADDPTAYDLRPAIVAIKGARVLRLMASVAAGDVPEHASIAEMLQRGWCPEDEDSIPLINAALILCADHELNASSFTARVVASAGAHPYAVIISGLSALQGVKHGGYTERVEAFLAEINTADNVAKVITARLRRGDSIPGFGHKLYPEGDPRAKILCDLISQKYPDSPEVHLARIVMEQAQELINEKPTIDFALAVLGRLYDLPAGSTLALFALGRTIGWIGHAIEQYQEDWLIRPRARYIGEQPE